MATHWNDCAPFCSARRGGTLIIPGSPARAVARTVALSWGPAGAPVDVKACPLINVTPKGRTSSVVISGRKFCCMYGTVTEFSEGDLPESARNTARHWIKRALGLFVAPSPSTRLQSDQVLSGEPVFPLRVNI